MEGIGDLAIQTRHICGTLTRDMFEAKGRLGALAWSWPQRCMCCAEVAAKYTELAATGRGVDGEATRMATHIVNRKDR